MSSKMLPKDNTKMKTTMTITCKAEFANYIKTCLGFIGSGTYSYDELTHTFRMNVSPHHKAMLRDFILDILRHDPQVTEKPEKIVHFNLCAENITLSESIALAQ